MANQALYDQAEFTVPEHILLGIRQALSQHGQAPGHERARNLLRNPTISYSVAKALKNALEQPEAALHPSFELAGGHAMRTWVDGELDRARQGVIRRKTVRSNAGLENQFIRTHEKNGAGKLTSPTANTGHSSVRRLELYEQTMSASTFAADAKKVAEALTAAFPNLTFEKGIDTQEVTIHAGGLKITIASAIEEAPAETPAEAPAAVK